MRARTRRAASRAGRSWNCARSWHPRTITGWFGCLYHVRDLDSPRWIPANGRPTCCRRRTGKGGRTCGRQSRSTLAHTVHLPVGDRRVSRALSIPLQSAANQEIAAGPSARFPRPSGSARARVRRHPQVCSWPPVFARVLSCLSARVASPPDETETEVDDARTRDALVRRGPERRVGQRAGQAGRRLHRPWRPEVTGVSAPGPRRLRFGGQREQRGTEPRLAC